MNDQENKKPQITKEIEEIHEKRTSLLGYIFLVIMAVFLLIVSQTILTDLSDIPKDPDRPAYCVAQIDEPEEVANVMDLPPCSFTEIDTIHYLDDRYYELRPELEKIVVLNKEISQIQREVSQKNHEINDSYSIYDVSLQEEIAGEQEKVTDKGKIKSTIRTNTTTISSLNAEMAELESKKEKIIAGVTPKILKLHESYEQAYDAYKLKQAAYYFKIFLLKLLFVLPFFVISLYYYRRLKIKNSPYTIIFTTLLTVSAIIFVEIAGVFMYDILPKEWFARIFKVLMEIPFMRYIIYYGSVALVVAVFGGFVYFLQKRIFDPKKVAIRNLKENKCPTCSFPIIRKDNYCRKCGVKLNENCPGCHKEKNIHLPHCPHCGE